eukprot:jgi/Astpho2/6426/e_gw1.00093.2.1_t
MLQTGNNPDRLQLLCNTSTSSSAAWQTQAAVLGINASCHLTTGSCKHVYSSAVCGVAGWFGQQDLQVLRQCMVGGISYTERDQEVIPALLRSCKQPLPLALWNLDKIDQRELPLNGEYRYGTLTTEGAGRGVTIYVVDSGVRISHNEFQPWTGGGPSRASYGFNFMDPSSPPDDCDGHGTFVASTAAGRSVGSDRLRGPVQAEVVAVRVLDCNGTGSISDTVAGLDWVASSYKLPAVISMSLGVPAGNWSSQQNTCRKLELSACHAHGGLFALCRILEDAVRSLILTNGITVVVASGNNDVDACTVAPACVQVSASAQL